MDGKSRHYPHPFGECAQVEADRDRLRAGVAYALDACERALRLSQDDRGSDGMARQVIRECRDALAAGLEDSQP